jgi:hypothetical protein
MAAELTTYVRRALGFRPLGMLFPPHLAVLAAFGLLGFVNPGFLLIGAAVELTYVLAMVTHPRFRALVDREEASAGAETADEAVDRALAVLTPADRARFEAVRQRCEDLIAGAGAEHEADALAGLLQVHLGLLAARAAMARVVASADRGLDGRLQELEARLTAPSLEPALQRSLASQRAVLAQRVEAQEAAERKLEFVEAELTRVEEQVALLGAQAALAAGPGGETSDRVDAIAGAIAETRRWLEEQPDVDAAERAPRPMLRARRVSEPRG